MAFLPEGEGVHGGGEEWRKLRNKKKFNRASEMREIGGEKSINIKKKTATENGIDDIKSISTGKNVD